MSSDHLSPPPSMSKISEHVSKQSFQIPVHVKIFRACLQDFFSALSPCCFGPPCMEKSLNFSAPTCRPTRTCTSSRLVASLHAISTFQALNNFLISQSLHVRPTGSFPKKIRFLSERIFRSGTPLYSNSYNSLCFSIRIFTASAALSTT